MKKNISAYIIAVALLISATSLVLALSVTGKLPFLNNNIPQTSISEESDEPDESEDIDESFDESFDESEISGGDESEVDRLDEFVDSLSGVNTDGYTVTDAMFDKSVGKLVIVKKTVAQSNVLLLPRMGFIFQTIVTLDEDGELIEEVSLLDERGEVIFDVLEREFAGVRDALDNPLFKEGKKYYYLDRETLEFIETTYSDGENGRGIEFDYPSYYGRYQDDSIVRKKRSGQWGLYDPSIEDYIVYPYRDMVFTFNGNPIACAYDNDSSRLRFYKLNTDLLTEKYYKPTTNGIENIGYYHFVNELTRVRRVYNENGKKASAEELMYTDGTLFNLPGDFTLKAYSDGILLLCREDKYGYMSSNGSWITNPEYDSAAPFIEGLAVVGKDGKYGVITTDGTVVVPLVFDSITNCSGGVMVLTANGEGQYILNKYMPVPEIPDEDVSADESTEPDTSDGDYSMSPTGN